MKVYDEIRLRDFNAWAGGVETKARILREDKDEEFDFFIEGEYPEGISATQLNDLLWFEEDWLFEMLGIEDEEE